MLYQHSFPIMTALLSDKGTAVGASPTSVVEGVGTFLLGSYHVTIIIVLINMLIAMMSHSFEAIQVSLLRTNALFHRSLGMPLSFSFYARHIVFQGIMGKIKMCSITHDIDYFNLNYHKCDTDVLFLPTEAQYTRL